MRRLLVTGGAGFIGANFVQHWLAHNPGDRVIVLDALTYAGNRANLAPVYDHPNFRFVVGNICDAHVVEQLMREEAPDTIVNFAAESHVDRSILAPDAFIQSNIVGTHRLLQAACDFWIQQRSSKGHRFHHVSTDEVYGSLSSTDPAFLETTPYAPRSPYAASKACSDHLVRAYHHTYGLPATISNCSNNYGPLHFPEKLIPLVIVNILTGRRLPVYGDGEQVRDWLHVSDHCEGVALVIERGREGETYNIGGRSECRNIDVVRTLCTIADEAFASDHDLVAHYPSCPAAKGARCETLIEFVKDRPGHDRRYSIDCSKIERELGFRCSVGLDEGLRRTFAWYAQNESWWRAVMDGSYLEWTQRQYGGL